MESCFTACIGPIWNSELRDNWNGILIGKQTKPMPKFELIMKKVKKGYKSGRTYKCKLLRRKCGILNFIGSRTDTQRTFNCNKNAQSNEGFAEVYPVELCGYKNVFQAYKSM